MTFLKLTTGETINIFQVVRFLDSDKAIDLHFSDGQPFVISKPDDMEAFRRLIRKHPAE